MSTASRAARDLDAAAALIERVGWRDQGGGSCNTGFCLADALAHVVGRDGRDSHRVKRHTAAIDALAAHIRAAREAAGLDRVTGNPRPMRTVVLYNDVHLSTLDGAVAALRGAARALRQPEQPTDERNTRS